MNPCSRDRPLRALPRVTAAQFRALLDSFPGRIAFIGRDRRYRYVNQEYAAFWKRPVEHIVGRTVAEIIGDRAFAHVRDYGERCLNGETLQWEGWFNDGDETERYVQFYYSPHIEPDGAIDAYFVFIHDLTGLKTTERELASNLNALRASDMLNSAITSSALDCIIVTDETGHVVEFNPAAERTFGYRRAETLGRSIGDLIVPPALRDRHAAGMRRFLETGEPHVIGRRVELEGMRADGTTFPVELTITEVRLPDRRLLAAYLRDLTEARNAAAEIERGRDALYQREKLAAMGSLLAGVAHELNNPLSIVIGNALMLHDETAASPDLAGRAERIQKAAERCARIVRTFLAMARQHKTVHTRIDIETLIATALDLLAYGLRTSGVEILRDIATPLPQIMADEDQMHQVLVNLIVNAQQALETRSRPRRLSIAARANPRSGMLEIAVADNGPGVPAAIRNRIFDPFFTTKPTGMGTGIGLSVSRGLVEAHGGALTLANTSTAGSTFLVCLPLQPPSAVGAEADAPGRANPDVRACRALVIDDEPEIAAVLCEMLIRLGFRCDVAGDGYEAKSRIVKAHYDVILCDLRMPGLDGPALYGWLEANHADLCGRMVFLTGDTLGAAAGRFLADCGCPVIEKPFVPETIRRIVAAFCPQLPFQS
jgi:PAS domain S-box-containing protein